MSLQKFLKELLEESPGILPQLYFLYVWFVSLFQIVFPDSVWNTDFPFLDRETIDEYVKNKTIIWRAKIKLFHRYLRFFKAIANSGF